LQLNLQTSDLAEIRKHFQESVNTEVNLSVIKKLDRIDILEWHRMVATRQRESYNRMKENIPYDYLFIELDWKQKLSIGQYNFITK